MATAQATTTKGGLYGSNLIEYIVGRAKQLHLDPAAVLAVASTEGGFNGAVGDQGTSYGPFQLHQGGKLPSGLSGAQAQAFANSPAGVDYALAGIAGVASGQTGTTAISSIVSRFEQPQNPSAEIATATGRYPTASQEAGTVSSSGFGSNLLSQLWKQVQSPIGLGATGVTPPGIGVSPGIPGVSLKSILGFNFTQIGEMLGGGVLILLGLVMIVLGGRGAPQVQTARAVRAVVR